jgi:hypothetical protein
MGTLQTHFEGDLAALCQLAVIRCSDFRHSIGDQCLRRFRAIYGDEQTTFFDEITVPGSCYSLARAYDSMHGRVLLDQIGTLIGAHNPEAIVIIQHTECAWYRRHGIIFDDEAHECKVLIEDALQAGERISDSFPNVKIDILLAHTRGLVPIGRLERMRRSEDAVPALVSMHVPTRVRP